MADDQTTQDDQEKRAEARKTDAELEIRRATRHAEQRGEDAKFDWLLSNRVDDRVVLHERSEAHPGGECFVGGDGVDYCAHTPAVDNAIRAGLILVVPEPKDGRSKPQILPIASLSAADADVPGTPTRLGRVVNPDLFDAAQIKQIEKAQERTPDEIPVPAEVVKPAEPAEAKQPRNGNQNNR